MNENGVIINDLNAECRRIGKPKKPDVHDVGDLSPKVTKVVLEALTNRHNPSRPVPRVLFIGDSITGTYWGKVKQNLDGKAFVAKNPGNGEHSGTGARLVDQWVDLKQYMLNGQEYLELVGAVKETLANINGDSPSSSIAIRDRESMRSGDGRTRNNPIQRQSATRMPMFRERKSIPSQLSHPMVSGFGDSRSRFPQSHQ